MKKNITNKDLKKIGLDLYLGEQDINAINELALKIIPLFKGKTFHQINEGTKLALEMFNSSYTIK